MQITLYPTKLGVTLDKCDLVNKIMEESTELCEAILSGEYDAVEEEVMDVIQMCYNVIEKYDIDIELAKRNHFRKLLDRDHEFIMGGDNIG